MKSLSRENRADIIEAFNSFSRYLDDLLNIDNIYFDQMVDRIYRTELQLNRANSSDTEARFRIWIYVNLIVQSTKLYDKRDDFDILINLMFMFSLWCIDWAGSLYANRIFMHFCIKSSIGTQGEVG